MQVKVRSSAYRDLLDGANFYERRERGLGTRFFDTLWDEIHALSDTGGIHAKILDSYHRFISGTFPYAILYRIEAHTVVVYAVFDCRRNPGSLRRKLR